MPLLLFKEDIIKHKEFILSTLIEGGIIIYPTDTLYGIGGRADWDSVAQRVYDIKKRDKSLPLNVIAPDFDYIENNFILKENDKKILHKYLPGPYTPLLLPQESCSISKLTYSNLEKKGIRICNHYIQDLVFELQLPLISTSANISGDESAKVFDDISPELLKQADIVIVDDDNVSGYQSKIFDIEDNRIISLVR
ncbi:MAG: L-threonylcarbamoyladenylate synthase [Candidatus Nanoarchaeia archaeon]